MGYMEDALPAITKEFNKKHETNYRDHVEMIQDLLDHHYTLISIARELGIHRCTFAQLCNRLGLKRPKVTTKLDWFKVLKRYNEEFTKKYLYPYDVLVDLHYMKLSNEKIANLLRLSDTGVARIFKVMGIK